MKFVFKLFYANTPAEIKRLILANRWDIINVKVQEKINFWDKIKVWNDERQEYY